jgi:hypothetical protein
VCTDPVRVAAWRGGPFATGVLGVLAAPLVMQDRWTGGAAQGLIVAQLAYLWSRLALRAHMLADKYDVVVSQPPTKPHHTTLIYTIIDTGCGTAWYGANP